MNIYIFTDLDTHIHTYIEIQSESHFFLAYQSKRTVKSLRAPTEMPDDQRHYELISD